MTVKFNEWDVSRNFRAAYPFEITLKYMVMES